MNTTTEQFVWTDELVNEFILFRSRFYSTDYTQSIDAFRKFKLGEDFLWSESKVKKEEPKQLDNVKLLSLEDYILQNPMPDCYTRSKNEWEDELIKNWCSFFKAFKKQNTEEPPKTYEILRFHYQKPTNCNHVHLKKDGKYYYSSGMYSGTLESHLGKDSEWKINSVKRLSDGEVFSVGDECTYGVIEKFNIEGSFMYVYFTNKNGATLASLTKAPKEGQLPIKVHSIKCMAETTNDVYYSLITSKRIPESKYEPIKKAILDVLNEQESPFNVDNINKRIADLKGYLCVHEIIDEIRRHCDGSYSIDPQDWDLPRKASEIIEPLLKRANEKSTKLYTSDELLEAQKKSFEAAREYNPVDEWVITAHINRNGCDINNKERFKTFNEYIQSLNK